MAGLTLKETDTGDVPTPASGKDTLYINATPALVFKDDAGTDHVLGDSGGLLTADPASPANDTWWVVRTGTSPTMTVALKVRIAGATYTVASITL